jgi:xanthine dehydrogenase small subunit
LIGQSWSEATIDAAVQALAQDYTPLTDVRGSSAYRQTVAGNLLHRLWAQYANPDEQVSVLSEALSDG